MSQLKVDEIVDASGGSNAVLYGPASPAGSMGFRNRIINGDMRIDQRNAGAAVTANGAYPIDRFYINNSTDGTYSAQQSSTSPAGFTNSIAITVGTADTNLTTTQTLQLVQRVEGYNMADFSWGSADAKTITISFWVRSSLTGTFGGSLKNSVPDLSYPFTYTINSANTWEQKSITISGPTSGTWDTTNGVGIQVIFNLGAGPDISGTAGAWASANYANATGATSLVGTSGATWYITGVQLEVGSVATEFERRPYGTELALCQRYYQKIQAVNTDTFFANGGNSSTTSAIFYTPFAVYMRTDPTAVETSGSASDYRIRTLVTNINASGVPVFWSATNFGAAVSIQVASGLGAGDSSFLRALTSNAYLAWSAEL